MAHIAPKVLAGLLFAFAIMLPYSVVTESISGGGRLWFVSVFWAIGVYSDAGILLEVPLGRTIDFLPFWGLGVLLAYLAYVTAKNQDISQIGYVLMVITVLILQVGYMVVLQVVDVGGPSSSYVPIPLVALFALILTPLTVHSRPKFERSRHR
ncbi:MAG: hypothetical protein EAX95_06610 [Candidatus Thorarchaeota archaeon]|nr:hypothetical protein [Candidatus Thorarchaeota archaeon]